MTKHKIGLWSATFLGISTIIGSGWLFAPYRAAQVAGPMSLLSWIIGAFIVGLLAMCFSEIAALYPQRGLSAIIPTLSHNKYFGFPFALTNWLGIVAVIALEAEGTIQYLISLAPSFSDLFFINKQFTLYGNLLAVVLVIFFCLANYWGIRLLAKTNNIFALIKIVIPLVTVIMIITAAFHPANFTAVGNTIAPYGYTSVFGAILTCGIIVAFNGFQTVVSFANEIKNPNRNIPLSMGLALGFCLAVYLLLQVSFIGAVPTAMLAHGWNNLGFIAPMADLPILLGLGYLSSVIYFGATIAPCSAGITFTGTATRMFSAMASYGQMPKYFEFIDPRYGISRRALLFNILLSVMFLFMFRSWSEMAVVLGLLHVLSYLPTPLALVVFRNRPSLKNQHPFFIPFGKPIAAFVFVVFTCLFGMAPFKPVCDIFIMFAVFQFIYVVLNIKSITGLRLMFSESWGLVLFFGGLLLLVWAAPQNHNVFSEPSFFALMILFSFVSFLVLCQVNHDEITKPIETDHFIDIGGH